MVTGGPAAGEQVAQVSDEDYYDFIGELAAQT